MSSKNQENWEKLELTMAVMAEGGLKTGSLQRSTGTCTCALRLYPALRGSDQLHSGREAESEIWLY